MFISNTSYHVKPLSVVFLPTVSPLSAVYSADCVCASVQWVSPQTIEAVTGKGSGSGPAEVTLVGGAAGVGAEVFSYEGGGRTCVLLFLILVLGFRVAWYTC